MKAKKSRWALTLYRISKKEFGGGVPKQPQSAPPLSPQLKQLKTKVLHQLDCLELSFQNNSKQHIKQAVDALRKKTLDPNQSWDNIRNPFKFR